MNLRIKNRMLKKGVFSVEFVTLIVLLSLALLAMRFYLRRSTCGSYRSTGDAFGQGRQYEPGVTIVTEY